MSFMVANPPTALERAFELAKSGRSSNIVDIRRQLLDEGLDPNQITGPILVRQLRDLIAKAARQ
jgi:hypothetical protein